MMAGKERSVEKIIKQAVNEEWQLAFDMLSSQGLSLPWMEKRNSIEVGYSNAIEKLYNARQCYYEKKGLNEEMNLIEEAWEKAQKEFIKSSEDLNQLIDSYNLDIPNDRFYRKLINAEEEISNLEK